MLSNSKLNAFALFGLLAAGTVAAAPATINLHGQLLSSSGEPVNGARAYMVQFHDAGTGGATIGGALTGTVEVSADGLFNLEVTPPAGILTATEVWYSLGVDTDEPADSSAADDVFPSRIRVHSVPFALQANEVVAVDAVRIGGGAVDNTEFGALDGVTGNIQGQIDAIDLTGITADISQLESDVAAKANSTDVYTKSEVDTTVTGLETDISAKANSTDVYTKAEVDTTVTGLETDISAKANSTDVYTKTDADDKFLDVTGDSMAGTLGVDTIGEATAAAGVTIDGVRLKDNFVELTAITAPGVTANRLYNTGGNLFWNGSQLDAGGGGGADKDTLNWGTDFIGDAYAGAMMFAHEMPADGTLISFQVWCSEGTGNFTIDLRKNGTTVLSGPVAFVSDSLEKGTIVTPSFSAGDVFTLWLDNGTADLYSASASIIVEY